MGKLEACAKTASAVEGERFFVEHEHDFPVEEVLVV